MYKIIYICGCVVCVCVETGHSSHEDIYGSLSILVGFHNFPRVFKPTSGYSPQWDYVKYYILTRNYTITRQSLPIISI